jgi:hypothetical protein
LRLDTWQLLRFLVISGLVYNSKSQEKYLQELSITPMGYFTGAIKITPVGCPTGKNKVFQSNRSDFPQGLFLI